MDLQDLQPNNSKPPDEPAVGNGSGNSAEHIFDISEDSISPISSEDFIKQTPAPQKSPAPQPKTELLDQKIGTFDPSPFAPATQVAGVQQYRGFVKPETANVAAPKDFSAKQTPSLIPIPTQKPEAQPTQFAKVPEIPQQNRQIPEATPQNIAKPVRTYESDVAEVMSHKKISTASIAIAESQKQQGSEIISDEVPSHIGRKITMTIVGLLLLVGGAYGAYYLYSNSALAPIIPAVQPQKATPGFIPSVDQIVITIDNQNPMSIRRHILNEISGIRTPDTIIEFIITKKDATGSLSRVSAPDIIKTFEINAPDILSRSLAESWMFGVYNDINNNKNIFIVGTTNFFQNAFAGMLQWERVMADDLRQYLYSDTIVGISNNPTPISTTTNNMLIGIDSILPLAGTATATNTSILILATSTNTTGSSTVEIVEPLRQYLTIRGRFEDRIIKNKDVRAFRADTGEILFLYSFIDNTHLVFTKKESTLIEILNKLEKQSFIR
ncbi:MAG: hypothetical protein A3C79_03005 [Candidatus Taylorbacteria bacterium RIFCSPHIGHO2_02_FULL_45_28]|uniref:Uncharacterized protein n=1 Tax=Candidatus Taylorbacteria bacterium RIFCSPHIGHO2_12_FULL_45_16 TaxID=1802315 RepID=A0A1G2N0Y1_9BACT|nr:MAG: hypothetical protein A2830_00725 [Candidatus Taylorbacteria bacterium RIFCSPHIGHO2_01_FULL_44_110]OHA24930.1 MAG: hypothetical protein A3C79_03005 [Candidatus Taylorbacteria bacterium RIFCSPHIGHO2_02_FULL_45_28]OHA29748.1 MAG: hypothetical protein A3F51_03420 [Candidatus Taylorbacteria bacterium RIFCSPHIGHO2_12_FULL_45_16]OHA32692.1 MAG: hypothetical protein A3A23_00290 [Candidatus Taylorbacteria bacterium RIFCSPLOWO2_01_FULL_45_59]OHA39286.1 MAG: hypothetical protein A3I98_01420 [Candi